MIIDNPIRQLFLVQIEAKTAHAVHSGYADNLKDNLLVRDANGLPAIPASSIAGVLNHLYQQTYGKSEAEKLFGFAKKNESQISHLHVDWALIHNADNQPVEQLLTDLSQDSILSWLAEQYPLSRDRVRLNDKGAALDTAKFDVTLVPAGARYSFLLHLHSNNVAVAQQEKNRLLTLFDNPQFRLGHGTRNGYGAFEVLQVNGKLWDLCDIEQAKAYCAFSRNRLAARTLPLLIQSDSDDSKAVTLSTTLVDESGWRVGGGQNSLIDNAGTGDSKVNIMQQCEKCIQWENEQASLSERKVLIPASAVKGALSHRVAFHARRRDGIFAGENIDSDHLLCEHVKTLFGCVDEHDEGVAGKIIIDDVFLEPQDYSIQQLMHNKLDHFTGGVIKGALFSEELLWQSAYKFSLTIVDYESLSKEQLQPLMDTLSDLGKGWLTLGGGGSRGLGGMYAKRWCCSNETWLKNMGFDLAVKQTSEDNLHG